MSRHFTYPITLKKQKEGGYLIQFPDFPEAITQGEDLQDVIEQATDCLEETIANRIIMKMDIAKPSKIKKQNHCVMLNTTLAAKTALYLAMRLQKLSQSKLARKLSVDEKQIRRLLDPYYNSKLPNIEDALHHLGQQLEIKVSNATTLNHNNK